MLLALLSSSLLSGDSSTSLVDVSQVEVNLSKSLIQTNSAMAPPAQQQCSAPDCTYYTAEGIPTWELLLRALEIHQKSTHPSPLNVGAGGNTVKVDKKTRPAITPQMTEENWRFFNNEWERYMRQTKINGTQLLDELWECMTFAEGGSDSLQTEAAMIA